MVTRPVQRHDEDLSEARRHDGNARGNHGSSLSWTRAVAATLVVASVTASFGEPSRAEDRPHAESGCATATLRSSSDS